MEYVFIITNQVWVASWDVKCNDGLTLLLKPTEYFSPACVTEDTVKKLIARN